MAMNNVQQNIAVTIRQTALEVLEIKNRLSVITQMYATESMGTLTDADYTALPEFTNVTVAEMTGAKNALDAINTAIGDYSVNTNATKLTKIMNVVPR
jgi:hypothetical protein